MRTILEMAGGACLPWNSTDAGKPVRFEQLPQQNIDLCLMCPLHAGSCDSCDGHMNVKAIGRPKVEVDTQLLREMMKLKRTNAAMCAALGISKTTLVKLKKELLKEDAQ